MNRASSLLGGLAVIAIAVVFVVNFQPGGGTNQLKAGPDCAGEVFGTCIKATHFWASFRLAAGRLDSNNPAAREAKQLVLDGLVERELLLVEAKRLGIGVSDDELTKELVAGRIRFSLPARIDPQMAQMQGMPPGMLNLRQQFIDKKSQKFSSENYKRTVTELTRLSEADFREYQRAELIAARMRDLIAARVRVSESEARDEFNDRKAQAKVKHVRLRPAFYADRAADRSDSAVNAWAEKNAAVIDKEFEQRKKELGEACREASHILIDVPETAPEEAKKAAQATLEAAKKRIDDGESFGAVAREVTQDRLSRQDDGRFGCIPKGEMQGGLKAFEDALFGLEEGKVSDIISTSRGLHLIRLDKIQKGPDAEKAFKKRIARQMYLMEEGKRLSTEAAKEIQAAIKGGKSIEDALKAHMDKLPPVAAPKKDEPKKDAPKDEPKKDAPKDEPKKDAPKDEPKKDTPKDEPKKDAAPPKKDEPATEVDPFAPLVETSVAFTSQQEPFEDAAMGESPAGVAFDLKQPGEVAEKLIPLRDNGFAVMVLVERKSPDDAEWTKERENIVAGRRVKKQREALILYLARLRKTHQAEISQNAEFLPKPSTSASAGPPGGAPNPFDVPLGDE